MLCVSKGALCVLPFFHTNPVSLCNKICDSYMVDKETETQGDVTFFKGLTSKTQTRTQVSCVWVLFSPPHQPLRLWGLNMFPSHPLEVQQSSVWQVDHFEEGLGEKRPYHWGRGMGAHGRERNLRGRQNPAYPDLYLLEYNLSRCLSPSLKN